MREGNEFRLSKRNEKVLEKENSKKRRDGIRSCCHILESQHLGQDVTFHLYSLYYIISLLTQYTLTYTPFISLTLHYISLITHFILYQDIYPIHIYSVPKKCLNVCRYCRDWSVSLLILLQIECYNHCQKGQLHSFPEVLISQRLVKYM